MYKCETDKSLTTHDLKATKWVTDKTFTTHTHNMYKCETDKSLTSHALKATKWETDKNFGNYVYVYTKSQEFEKECQKIFFIFPQKENIVLFYH